MSKTFKGIAVFTPGGDLIYCIDPSKRDRWHVHLCAALQELLGLPEPPHFLIPAYTATIDRWFDPQAQQLKTFAEIYPTVARYQPLLDAAFGVDELVWQVVPWQEEICSPIVVETYRQQFAQLWENHNLIARLKNPQELSQGLELLENSPTNEDRRGYVLRLFVTGSDLSTKKTLEIIHQVLEQELQSSYTLKVIDILKHPEQAELDRISATPTLVRVFPQPVRRIVGKFDDVRRLVQIVLSC